MKYPTLGMMAMLGLCAFVYAVHPSMWGHALFGAVVAVCMWVMVAVGRYCDRREEQKRASRRPLVTFAALFFTLKAKAIVLFGLVVIALELIAWGVVGLIYDAMTVIPKIQRNDVAWNTKTRTPELAARPIRLISATPHEIHEADPSMPWAYRKAEGTRLEWSSDLVEWKAWEPTGAQAGFWRERE